MKRRRFYLESNHFSRTMTVVFTAKRILCVVLASTLIDVVICSSVDKEQISVAGNDLEEIDLVYSDGEETDDYLGLDYVIEQLNSRICEIDSKLDDVRNSFKSTILSLGNVLSTDKCDISYEGRCFHVVIVNASNVQVEDAKKLCGNLGWELGNVYDGEHYRSIENYMRSKIPEQRREITVWTGMVRKSQDGAILSLSGLRLNSSTFKLHPLHETETDVESRHVAIQVSMDPDDGNQGVLTYESTQELDGALCEL